MDDRRVLNGIFWILRSGARWVDLPARYGPAHHDLQPLQPLARKAGVWDRLMDAATKAHEDKVQMIDIGLRASMLASVVVALP